MLRIAYREGVTEPIEFDLGQIDPDTDAVSGEFDLSTATEIELLCRAARKKSVVKTFTLSGGDLSVIQDEDDNYRRIRLSPDGTELKFIDRQYQCYFKVTDSAGEISDWPGGRVGNTHFVIEMKEALG